MSDPRIRHMHRKESNKVDCLVCDGLPRREWEIARSDMENELEEWDTDE